MNQRAISGFSSGLVAVAVGAVLYFAVTATVSGIDINVVGVILMAVGAIGGLSAVIWGMSTQRRVVRTQAVPVQTTRVVQEPTIVETPRD